MDIINKKIMFYVHLYKITITRDVDTVESCNLPAELVGTLVYLGGETMHNVIGKM